ncbi:MAG: hypothetical protein WC789_11340 [Lentisphaeria bacterium]|jgi:hypothetical protein
MSKHHLLLVLALAATLLPAAWIPAAEPPPAAPRCRALLVGGTPGTPMHARHYANWLARFRSLLLDRAAPGAAPDLLLLTPQPEIPGRTGAATAATLQEAIASLAKRTAPQDQFILILIGHGQPDGALALPGPDLPPAQLAEALKPMPAERQIILDFTSCSGAAIPALAKPGRILVAANGASETADSEFAEFLLLTLEGKLTNTADEQPFAAPGRPLTLLTAFNAASHEFAQWIARQRLPKGSDGWLVQGRRSREIFRRLYGAADVPPAKQMAPPDPAVEKKDDVLLPLVPENPPDEAAWAGRRLPNGHPLLEDTGKSDGASALGPDGYQPLTGDKDGAVGFLAKQTGFGQPAPPAP